MTKQVYRIRQRKLWLWAGVLLAGVLTFSHRVEDMFSIIGLSSALVFLVFGVPYFLTLSIMIDDEGLSLVNGFGPIFCFRHNKVLFENISNITLDGLGNMVIINKELRGSSAAMKAFRIPRNTKGFDDLISKILPRVEPSIIDESLKMTLK